MGESLDISQLRSAVKASRIQWQRYALERMAERGISTADVKAVLAEGQRIEDYPDAYPLPSALFLGWHGQRPLHLVAAFDAAAGTAYVITAYEPNLEHFEADFRTRRRP
jgi:hypothetical protein